MAVITPANYTAGTQKDFSGAAGPPTSGTYSVTDWGIDQDGYEWYCVTAGVGSAAKFICGGRLALVPAGGASANVNVATVNGTATSVNAGAADAGTQRVAIATGSSVSSNTAQVAGTTTSVNAGTTDAGTQRVVVASDDVVSGDIKKLNGTTVSTNAGAPDAGTLRVVQSAGSAVQITNGTQNADTVAGDAGQNALLVAGNRKEITVSSSGAGAQILGPWDVSAYRWLTVQTTAQGSGIVGNLQGSNDNSNWVNVNMVAVNTNTQSSSMSGTLATILTGPVSYRYFRLNITALTSGTYSFLLEANSIPSQLGSTFSSQLGTWTVGSNSATGSAVPANAFYMGLSDGTNLRALTSGSVQSDSSSAQSTPAVTTMIYNGASYDRLRTPTTFKNVVATASGNTAVWTPTAGKKFRVMGYAIYVDASVATSGGGVITVNLQDATSNIGLSFTFYAPAVAGTTYAATSTSGPVSLGNGSLSALANNVLNVNLSAAITSGGVRVVAIGVEE